jgi:hypothetical protein
MVRFVERYEDLRDEAILAPVAGPLAYRLAQAFRDLAHEAAGRCRHARALMSAKR